jgi:hypothetical protein
MMSKTLQTRVEQLEQQTGGDGGLVVVKNVDEIFAFLSDDELEQRLQDARAQAGPGGDVVLVEYVQDWRGQP